MIRIAPIAIVFILLLFGLPEAAHANQPPAPETFFAEVLITPITLALFVLSGAAAIYDRKNNTPRAGFKRILTLLGITVLCVLSGMHEGFAVLLCLCLAIWGVGIALTMIRLSFDGAAGFYARWASRVGGVVLIPVVVFLASFSWVFFGTFYYETMGRDWSHKETLQEFFAYQRDYAARHEGQFHLLLPENCTDDLEKEDKEPLFDSGVWRLAREKKRNVNRVSVSYGPDLRSYELKITPVAFYSWPYNLIARRRAYYMDQTGAIRHELLTGPGSEATASSPIYMERDPSTVRVVN